MAPALGGPATADAYIRAILAHRIDRLHRSVGIAAGIMDPRERRFISHGTLGIGDPRPIGADTKFEIGSLTKVFTATLLAAMVERGEVRLDDPVANYLPAHVRVPSRRGKHITLLDLATHTSGLPRLPSNLKPRDIHNPYADYSADQLWEFLSRYKLTCDIGSQFEYSNLGFGLLGQALARRAGMDYEALVRARITGPLGMTNTSIALSGAMRLRMATGYTATGQPACLWDFPALAGAGALRSDPNDMLSFMAAHLALIESPLAQAMAATTTLRRPADRGEVALGWLVARGADDEIVWHNGATGGFRSFIGYDPRARVGVVLLSNMSTAEGVDDIGMHLLHPGAPLARLKPPWRRWIQLLNPRMS